ncbi:MAG: methyltransferase domain-containing protein [Alphaproteobacteria bacterium]|nr:methyltransferase domain-containing protein [Alphaproteobacteria bacterium]
MPQTIYESTHKTVAERSLNPQEQNRAWWEALPMTYAEWDSAERLPKTAADFEAINQAYLHSNPWIAENVRFKSFHDKWVLEIGCGAGSATCLFAKAGAHVTAIDLTAQAVAMTGANAAAQDLANVRVVRMDAEKLDLPDRSLDHVYSWGVIHHSNAPQVIFNHVGRVLRPGGGGLVMVYNRSSLRYWIKGLQWLVFKGKLFSGETMASVQRFFTDGFFHKHYSPRELARSLEQAGLSDVRLSCTHMNKKMIPLIPRFLDEWLKRHYGWLLIAEFKKTS